MSCSVRPEAQRPHAHLPANYAPPSPLSMMGLVSEWTNILTNEGCRFKEDVFAPIGGEEASLIYAGFTPTPRGQDDPFATVESIALYTHFETYLVPRLTPVLNALRSVKDVLVQNVPRGCDSCYEESPGRIDSGIRSNASMIMDICRMNTSPHLERDIKFRFLDLVNDAVRWSNALADRELYLQRRASRVDDLGSIVVGPPRGWGPEQVEE